jgi:peptide/nickel transport system ATP-binding protein
MPLLAENPDQNLLLDVKDLSVAFRTDEGLVRAVERVSFGVKFGQTLGIVGESGSGKSVTANTIMRLLPRTAIIDSGAVTLQRKDGALVDLTQIKPTSRTMQEIRGGEVAMIFQEPMSSFSPVHTIGDQMMEAIRQHLPLNKQEARELAIQLLEQVGISNPAQRVDQYAFELSGGMRQRAMIATALSTDPSLLIADEPTTALDVTIQAQILDLLRHLQEERHMAIIFISHNLGVIAQICDEIAVMYLGRIMEQGATREVIRQPKHPYTQRLLQAIPNLEHLGSRLQGISGDIPSPLERPKGCPFHTRCTEAIPGLCDVVEPATRLLSSQHAVNCHLYD